MLSGFRGKDHNELSAPRGRGKGKLSQDVVPWLKATCTASPTTKSTSPALRGPNFFICSLRDTALGQKTLPEMVAGEEFAPAVDIVVALGHK